MRSIFPQRLWKSNLFRWLAGILIALFLVIPLGVYAWRTWYNPCEVDAVDEASTFLVTQLKTYDGLYQVASTASRTSFGYPVLVMQQVQVDTQEVDVPACLQGAKSELINYMANVIRAFQAWGEGKEDAMIQDLVRQSDVHYDQFYDELEAVKECAPFCIR